MATTEIPITDRRRVRNLQEIQHEGSEANVGITERWLSATAGGVLMACGLKRPSWQGVLLTLGGAGLLHRAASGRCMMYDAAGVSSAERGRSRVTSVEHGQGIKVEKSVMINKPPEELYRFWRNFVNLPRFMNHLESVTPLGDDHSHWVAKAPAGARVEWDAEVYNERENELIAWRSLENADVNNAGSVRFRGVPHGRGTEVKVVLNYEPPGGKIGAAVAKLFGEEPGQQVEEDLHRFKQLMETGEVPTTAGQPSGKR
jgi:uncharacterized membrane protein